MRKRMRVAVSMYLTIVLCICNLGLAAEVGLKQHTIFRGEGDVGDFTPMPPLVNNAGTDVKRNIVSSTLGSNMVLQETR